MIQANRKLLVNSNSIDVPEHFLDNIFDYKITIVQICRKADFYSTPLSSHETYRYFGVQSWPVSD